MVDWLVTDLPHLLDAAIAAALAPLAAWIVLSGLDDLVVLFAFLHSWAHGPPADKSLAGPSQRVAIFVPCWREHEVIGDMVEHNIAAIRHDRFAFFIGAYPNDDPTVEAVRALEQRFDNVHLCLCPHDGPTSKADCMNWIYQGMLDYEERQGPPFDLMVIHDAEDLIHPDELGVIGAYARDYDMIQIPVLPLPTPFWEFTHGLYCDDFAEFHSKDFPARQAMGGFVPSCGVGTGYTRKTLERLADKHSNVLFEPSCLTEDYENGLRLKQLGCRQLFLPLKRSSGAPVATREYFPRTFRSAVKQRTRWVTGIALQTWEHHGWSSSLRQAYWLWRDRKGLVGNPVSLLSNFLFAYGAVTCVAAGLAGTEWRLGNTLAIPFMLKLLGVTLGLQVIHTTARMACVGRIYGLLFALGVPFRMIYGNLINSLATVWALFRYGRARLRRQPLVWVKTDHAYPSRAALLTHKKPLEDILVGSGYIPEKLMRLARAAKPEGIDIGEFVLEAGLLTEEQLYEAMSLQTGLSLLDVPPEQVPRRIARTLPSSVVRKWRVLPVRVENGHLHLASPRFPSDELHQVLRKYTRLKVRMELVTPTNFQRLAEQLL
ncbi:MAG: glycosyl transferase family protein [Bryobacteraceae bacterium]|nr:glycosyl transferase family protein [Bryobacteraceae bacterium]